MSNAFTWLLVAFPAYLLMRGRLTAFLLLASKSDVKDTEAILQAGAKTEATIAAATGGNTNTTQGAAPPTAGAAGFTGSTQEVQNFLDMFGGVAGSSTPGMSAI